MREGRKMEKIYDVIIVGSGPAGLSAAVYGKRAMLDVAVIEKAGYSGGQIVNTSEVDNYLGLQGINGFEMAMKFREHAEHFGAEFIDEEVSGVQKISAEDAGHIFEISTVNGYKFYTKTVILAMGAEHSKLNVPGENEYKGKGVSYCATCDGAFYKEKKVVVVGGGDVALEDAIYLSKLAKKVYIIHRRDIFRGAKSLQEKLLATENIEFIKESVVTEILGEGTVKKVKVKNVISDASQELDIDGIFIAVGMKPKTEFVKEFVKVDERGYIVASEDGVTDISGVFVAGDVRTKNLRQVITAVSDGANCISSVESYLNNICS